MVAFLSDWTGEKLTSIKALDSGINFYKGLDVDLTAFSSTDLRGALEYTVTPSVSRITESISYTVVEQGK